MVAKIRVLSEQTINEIAAGEVIENPASVVKELVENALDAGASEIAIEIRGGGRQLISVVDNGSGMSSDDALLCLERHATSKIRESADIFEISTMGFRGEAMPSIASISKFTLLTAEEGREEGTLILVEGGRLVSCGGAVRSRGTTVEVKQLFFNVPVRKKFQRSPAYDSQEIERICTAVALGHPYVSFQLISNQELLWRTASPATTVSHADAMAARIRTLLGSDIGASLSPLEVESEGLKLTGFVGLPHLHRPNRSGQYLLINGRWVTAPFLSYCIKEGYGTLLPANRHPLFILALELPPGTVDVNVHPQKREVRFLQESKLRELVRRGIAEALYGGGKVHTSATTLSQDRESCHITTHSYDDVERLWLPPIDSLSVDESDMILETKEVVVPPSSALSPLPWDAMSSQPSPFGAAAKKWQEPPLLSHEATFHPVPVVMATLPGYLLLDPLSAVGSPLLTKPVEAAPALFLVDQRRAHQRVLYEKLSGALEKQSLEVQNFLIPPTFDCSGADSMLLQEHVEALAAIGITLQRIGPHCWAVEALPVCLGDVDCITLFNQLIAAWRGSSAHEATLSALLARQLCSAAARAAVSGGRRLAVEEAASLLRQLSCCRHPALCPSGNAVAATFSFEELQRRF